MPIELVIVYAAIFTVTFAVGFWLEKGEKSRTRAGKL
jgi:hypothetical protein